MDWRSTLIALAGALSLAAVSSRAAAQSSIDAPSCTRADVTCVPVSGSVAFGAGATPPAEVDIEVSYPFGDGVEWFRIRTSGPDYRFVANIPRGANAAFVLRNLPLPWLNDRPVVFDRLPGPQSIVLRPDAGIPVTATFRYPSDTVAPPPFSATVRRSSGDRWFVPVEVSNGQLVFAVRPGEPYSLEARPAGFGPVFVEFPPQSGPHAVIVNVDRRARPSAQSFTVLEGPGWVPSGRMVRLPIALEEPAPSGGESLPFELSIVPGTAAAAELSVFSSLTAAPRARFVIGSIRIENDSVARPARAAAIRFSTSPFALDPVGVPTVPDIPLTLLDDDAGGLPPVLSVVGAAPLPSFGGAAALVRPEGGPGEDWVITFELDRPAPEGGAEITVDTVSSSASGAAMAISGVDFQAVVARLVVFPPGSRTATVRISGVGDDRVEPERAFFLALTNPRGLVPRDPVVEMRIVNDDVDGSPAARSDLLPVTPLPRANTLDVLVNDVLPGDRFPRGSLQITEAPSLGSATVDTRGTPSPRDDRIVYTPQAGRAGKADRLRYRLCDALGETCVSARVDIPIRPVPSVPTTFLAAGEAGFRDIVFSGLPALQDARIEVLSRQPEGDELTEGTAGVNLAQRFAPVVFHSLALPFLGTNGPAEANWTILVHLQGAADSDVDLYVSYDANNDGLMSDDEQLCASASLHASETCLVSFTQTRAGATRVLIGVANPGPTPVPYRVMRGSVGGVGTLPGFVATAPTRLAEGEAFPVRLSWRNDATFVRDGAYGVMRIRNAAGEALGDIPLAIEVPRVPGSVSQAVAPRPRALRDGQVEVALVPRGEQLKRVFVDVPTGARLLDVRVRWSKDTYVVLDASLRRLPLPTDGASTAALTAPNEDANSIRRSGDGEISFLVPDPVPGRWFVVLSVPSLYPKVSERFQVTATTTGGAAVPLVRPGGYFNPARSGHGLFLYPAGNDFAGLWYTYAQDGTPVWYYLQGARPVANGIWTAPIFRSGWNGSRNHLTEVGRATITPTANDAFQFTYVLDGELGSEPFSSFGRGCPSIGGRVVDASGHWFDPARSGTGYSVQLLPNYEFYAVFGYSARGVPRFLVAERGAVGAADDTLVLQQLRGFCPLCARAGFPERRNVGVLRREFVNGQLTRIGVDAAFTNGTPGTWTANDAVVPLGGLQGCAAQ